MLARLKYEKCIQNVQELGSDDDYMFSQVFLSIEYPDKSSENLVVSVKQIAGGNFESDPLEVYFPEGKKYKLNYEHFRQSVENYYRSNVGTLGSGIRIQGSGNIKMFNNTFVKYSEDQVEYSDEFTVGW